MFGMNEGIQRVRPAGVRTSSLSPRLKMAYRLYHSATVPTKAAAAKAAGLSPATFYIASRPKIDLMNPEGTDIAARMDDKLDEQVINARALLSKEAIKSIIKLAQLRDTGGSEGIQLKAAQDIADRCPDTSKTQRIESSNFSLEGKDVANLVNALVHSRSARSHITEGLEGDFIKVDSAQVINESS